MKKTLLLLGFVLTAIVANAQSFKDAVSDNAPLLKTTSANNTAAPAERVLKAPSKALMHKLSVPKDEKPIFDPEGEDEARQVKIAFSDGKFFISGLASKSPEEVYEGTYSGTTASIPSFQIVKDADGERRVTKEIVK